MHLGNGAITPECAAIGYAVGGAGLAYAWRAARMGADASAGKRPSLLSVAALGGLVFAAQMINLPVLESSSAHFVGGVLLAELLGPAVAALAMSAVLLVQALLLGDGGLAALGVNIVNMALVPAGLLAALKKVEARFAWHRAATLTLASAGSIAIAVALIAGQVALGRSGGALAGWSDFTLSMIGTHLLVLPLEAALTLALVWLWRSAERHVAERSRVSQWSLSAGAVLLALLLAGSAWALSSELPDGYESAAEATAMAHLLTDDAAEIAALGKTNAALHSLQTSVVESLESLSSEAPRALLATLLAASLASALCWTGPGKLT
jgi:cobalt/nickel transport system permease protein